MEYFCASYNIDLKESKLEIFIQLCKASKNVKKWNMITYTTVRIVYLKEWFLIDIYVKRWLFFYYLYFNLLTHALWDETFLLLASDFTAQKSYLLIWKRSV